VRAARTEAQIAKASERKVLMAAGSLFYFENIQRIQNA
jgi:hypothetical protein